MPVNATVKRYLEHMAISPVLAPAKALCQDCGRPFSMHALNRLTGYTGLRCNRCFEALWARIENVKRQGTHAV